MSENTVAIGSDHAGYEMKEFIKDSLRSSVQSMAFVDAGTHSTDSVDYPDYAHQVAIKVEKGEVQKGILICGSGNGVCMAANKHQGIRAALCWTKELAMLARQHNDANILCIPARFISKETALEMVDVFMSTAFEGGRHANRVAKITC